MQWLLTAIRQILSMFYRPKVERIDFGEPKAFDEQQYIDTVRPKNLDDRDTVPYRRGAKRKRKNNRKTVVK